MTGLPDSLRFWKTRIEQGDPELFDSSFVTVRSGVHVIVKQLEEEPDVTIRRRCS